MSELSLSLKARPPANVCVKYVREAGFERAMLRDCVHLPPPPLPPPRPASCLGILYPFRPSICSSAVLLAASVDAGIINDASEAGPRQLRSGVLLV